MKTRFAFFSCNVVQSWWYRKLDPYHHVTKRYAHQHDLTVLIYSGLLSCCSWHKRMRTSVIRLVSKFVLNVILESTDSVSVQVIAFSALLSPYTYRLVAKFDNCSFFFFDDSKLVRNFGGGGGFNPATQVLSLWDISVSENDLERHCVIGYGDHNCSLDPSTWAHHSLTINTTPTVHSR